ncbi:hypothetical protein ACJ67_07210 [Methylophilus sp. TWE2]|nr:hypothetical protein ACJ67_07210 [Methylophilus sp. TWE2]
MVFGPLSAAPSSAVSAGDFDQRLSEVRNKHVVLACQGEFRWPPTLMSNAGIKRKLGCTFFWLLYLCASKEK